MGGDEGPSFLPTNMMGGSDPSAAEKSKGADKSKGIRTLLWNPCRVHADKRSVEKVDEVQKTATGGGNASADDPLGLGK